MELTVSCAVGWQLARFVDRGRPGHRAEAISSGGAADPHSARLVNELLAQPADHPCLEIAMAGGRWHFSGRGQIALTGADMDWHLDGYPADRNTVIYLDGNHSLSGSAARKGFRAYLGIKGVWELPKIMGSIEVGLPGMSESKRMQSFTVISDREAPFRSELLADPENLVTLVATQGPEWWWLDPAKQHNILVSEYRVSPHSNRQGVRLTGNRCIASALPELLSSPVLPGTIQLTPEGLILLGPDAQTVGGYPRVLVVGNYAAIYQVPPGALVRLVLAT